MESCSSSSRKNSNELHAKDAILESPNGKIKLLDPHHKIVIFILGYTYCPEASPNLLFKIQNTLKELSKNELKQIRIFFLTIDPTRDSLEKLKSYTEYFSPSIIPLRTSENDLQEISKHYNFFYQKIETNHSDYSIDHSNHFYLISNGTNPSIIEISSEISIQNLIKEIKYRLIQ